MKFFTICFFLFFSFNCFSQELNDNAQVLKENYSQTYEAIKEFSVREWKNDHSMVLYEINQQSDSFFKVIKLFENHSDIFSKAVIEWGENVTKENLLQNSSINWKMVLYEMNKQIKSKDAY